MFDAHERVGLPSAARRALAHSRARDLSRQRKLREDWARLIMARGPGAWQYPLPDCARRFGSPLKLLLVEDDRMLAETVCDGIRQHGWDIDHVTDAVAAKIALVDHTYAAVLLDLGLSGDSGLSILKRMRERYDSTPVLILTARGQLSDRIRGLDAGADDYLVKPFPFDELLARVRAVMRRAQGRVVPAMSYGDVTLDPAKRLVTRAGARVSLSSHEYRTLLVLLERRGHVVTREHLENMVYGSASSIESNTIAVFIHQLRRKLGDDIIATVHGQGYMIGESRS